ncbi:MAG: hypothetical protein SGILL_002383 [Bacillariaceae sp.]
MTSLLDAAGVVTGDIWCSGAFSFESPLKDLLDSGEYTLEQLLAEDELLQELRGMHPQLIEFLSSEESVAGLIQYVILPSGATPPTNISVVTSKTGGETENGGDDSDEAKNETSGEAKQADAKATGNDEIAASMSTEVPTSAATDFEETPQPPAKEPGKWLQGSDVVEDQIPVPQKTEQEEKDAFYVRFPYMACEVICCEIKGIIDILVEGFVPASIEEQIARSKRENGNQDEPVNGTKETRTTTDQRGRPILDLLFSIMYESKPGEIDDYRAGYFDKILSVLFRKRPEAMSEFINSGGGKGGEILMGAMINHLYSHSMMQIVQRLLLPTPVLPPKTEEEEAEEEGEDLFADTMEGADMDGLGSFRCNWPESDKSLGMLLDSLIGNKIAPEIEADGERKLSQYQNASEVLITIIQNSPLTSPTLRSLTEDPIMGRLVNAATFVQEGSTFSNHDSRLTCAMNVLESLILQLGGYGSVATMAFPDEEEGQMDVGVVAEIPISGEEFADSSLELSLLQAPPQAPGPDEIFATTDTLIQHLPDMLLSMSNLLAYPGAEEWVSPVQFSRNEPQKILGSSRLRIVRLLESLVLLGDPTVDSLLCDSSCLDVCLDLFWKFQWCSMLHQSVANLLVHVFEGQNARSELQSYFLVKCNLLGRLMDSFWEGTEDCIASPANVSNAEISQSLMDQKDGRDGSNAVSSVASEKGSADNDLLPVSDDDVDAAMEQQQEGSSSNAVEEVEVAKVLEETPTTEPETHAEHTPPQSFRLGYMGHVIIICQALVHACTNDGKSESPSLAGGAIPEEMNGELANFVNKFSNEDHQETVRVEDIAAEALERGRAGESVATEETPSTGPLILAQLVDTHPLNKNWQEFVSTTLATETAVQSTPLGGFPAGALGMGMDPLHAHRPGLAEDGAYDDDDGAPPRLPPRGLLVGGDVIDMDDNDLDVAASMMAGGLRLHQPDESGDDRSKDLLSGMPPQSNGPSGGYVFDDPLGDGRFGKFDEDEDDDSSSDEESEQSGRSCDSGGAVGGPIYENPSENDAPVMDLFAGNFDAFSDKGAGEQNGAWSDFANFDDAFAGSENNDDNPAIEAKSNFDDVFGDVKDHAMLLEDPDNPTSSESAESFVQTLSAAPTADEGATPQPEPAVS